MLRWLLRRTIRSSFYSKNHIEHCIVRGRSSSSRSGISFALLAVPQQQLLGGGGARRTAQEGRVLAGAAVLGHHHHHHYRQQRGLQQQRQQQRQYYSTNSKWARTGTATGGLLRQIRVQEDASSSYYQGGSKYHYTSSSSGGSCGNSSSSSSSSSSNSSSTNNNMRAPIFLLTTAAVFSLRPLTTTRADQQHKAMSLASSTTTATAPTELDSTSTTTTTTTSSSSSTSSSKTTNTRMTMDGGRTTTTIQQQQQRSPGEGGQGGETGTKKKCPFYGCPLGPQDVHYNTNHIKMALERLRETKRVDFISASSSTSTTTAERLLPPQQRTSSSNTNEQKDRSSSSTTSSSATTMGELEHSTTPDASAVTLTLVGYKGGQLRDQINQDRAVVVSPFYINSNPTTTTTTATPMNGTGSNVSSLPTTAAYQRQQQRQQQQQQSNYNQNKFSNWLQNQINGGRQQQLKSSTAAPIDEDDSRSTSDNSQPQEVEENVTMSATSIASTSAFMQLDRILVGVFDGHAPLGEVVSDYTATELPKLLANKLPMTFQQQLQLLQKQQQQQSWEDGTVLSEQDEMEITAKVLTDTFIELDRTAPADPSGGCTATVVLKQGNKIYVANAGDSRSFIVAYRPSIRRAEVVYVSREDKPDLPDERARVEAAGGQVYIPVVGTSRVVYLDPKTGAPTGLAMSRSIGDWDAGRLGVIPDPIVEVLDIDELVLAQFTNEDGIVMVGLDGQQQVSNGFSVVNEQDDDVHLFAVSATDGMMDYLLASEIANVLAPSLFDDSGIHPLSACEHLIFSAAQAWQHAKQGRYRDDITIAVSAIRWPPSVVQRKANLIIPSQ